MRELRTQYVARFASLAGVALCMAHDGELDDAEVSRIGVAKTPAVLVTCLGLADTADELGGRSARLRWVAVVIARPPDAVRQDRNTSGDVAALLAMRVVYELAYGEPFPAALERPSDVRAVNLVGTRAQARGYALWAVTWEQATDIEDIDAVLHDFLALHTDFDLPPTEGVDMSARVEFPEPEDP